MGSGGPKAPGVSPIQMGGAGSFNSVNTPYQPPSAGPVPNWMEGGKFTARDAIGLALAAIGDNIGPNGGSMLPMMMQHRMSLGNEGEELDRYRKKKEIDLEFAQPDIAPMLRDARTWQQMSKDEQAAMAAIERLRNPPPYFTGGDGQSYQRPDPSSPAAYGLDPNRYEVIPEPTGGPTPQASGNFLPPRRRR